MLLQKSCNSNRLIKSNFIEVKFKCNKVHLSKVYNSMNFDDVMSLISISKPQATTDLLPVAID